jgi:hypothetical protein
VKISAMVVGGSVPGLARPLRRRSTVPSASISLRMRFSPILSAPLSWKARAISRLPIFAGARSPAASRSRAMNARISSREGRGAGVGFFVMTP